MPKNPNESGRDRAIEAAVCEGLCDSLPGLAHVLDAPEPEMPREMAAQRAPGASPAIGDQTATPPRPRAPGASVASPGPAPAPVLDYIAPDLRGLAVPIDQLRADPRNARQHGTRDLDALAESLRRYGQRKPIVARAGSSVVLAGNGTLAAARRLGWSHVAVTWFTGTDAEARAFAIADNRTAELSRGTSRCSPTMCRRSTCRRGSASESARPAGDARQSAPDPGFAAVDESEQGRLDPAAPTRHVPVVRLDVHAGGRVSLRLDWCSHEAARYACRAWHYSRSVPTPPHRAGRRVGARRTSAACCSHAAPIVTWRGRSARARPRSRSWPALRFARTRRPSRASSRRRAPAAATVPRAAARRLVSPTLSRATSARLPGGRLDVSRHDGALAGVRRCPRAPLASAHGVDPRRQARVWPPSRRAPDCRLHAARRRRQAPLRAAARRRHARGLATAGAALPPTRTKC
jgi:hypothetical protein